jgi:hypothetical protein
VRWAQALIVVNTFTEESVMNPSIKNVLNRITLLVVVTLAVAAVFDWTGLSR